MSKSRRKSNGCKRGTYKRKRMGKGWLTANKPQRPRPIPVKKDEEEETSENVESDES